MRGSRGWDTRDARHTFSAGDDTSQRDTRAAYISLYDNLRAVVVELYVASRFKKKLLPQPPAHVWSTDRGRDGPPGPFRGGRCRTHG